MEEDELESERSREKLERIIASHSLAAWRRRRAVPGLVPFP